MYLCSDMRIGFMWVVICMQKWLKGEQFATGVYAKSVSLALENYYTNAPYSSVLIQ